MKKHLAFAIIIVVSLVNKGFSQIPREHVSFIYDEAWSPRPHPVDMEKLELEVSFVPEEKKVIGSVRHTFRVLQQKVDTLFLDGPGIQVSGAKLDEEAVGWKVLPDGIVFYFANSLTWDEVHKLDIEYTANPAKGLYFIGWDDPKNISRKQIWSQGQGTDNRHWIPMYDEMNDKVISEVKVTFPADYQVLSNGVLISKKVNKDKENKLVWQYKMSHPHAPYLIMLGIGDYKIKTIKSASGTDINLWYYPDQEDRVEYTYLYMKEMFDFFEKEIGVPYPWENYSQIPVQEFMYGAMENTTATVFGDFFCTDRRAFGDRNYVAVNAHELAHQWFGDMVTARTASHHWLQESFATYYNYLFEREAFGQEHFDFARRAAVERALEAGLNDNLPIAHSQAGSPRNYPKGAMVLDMLKYVVGHEAYNRAIQYYLKKHAYGNVDSEDLLIAFHECLGVSLDWFWAEWVYKGGEPAYEVNFTESASSGGGKTSVFEVTQVHTVNEEVGLFSMPFWFQVHYTDGTTDSVQVTIQDKFTRVEIPNPSGKTVAFPLFDPNSRVIKKVSFPKSKEYWLAQLENAPHILDRYDAAVALKSTPVEQKWAVFKQVFEKETYYRVRAEIVSQIAKEEPKNKDYQALIEAALTEKDNALRKETLYALTSLDNRKAGIVSGYFNDPDASYDLCSRALELLVQSDPSMTPTYLEMSKSLEGIGRSFRIKWLEIALTAQEDHFENQQELIFYTSQSFEFRTRVAAAQALQRLNMFNEDIFFNLIQSLGSANKRLSGPMASVLKDFYRVNSYKGIIEKALQTKNVPSDQITRTKKLLGIP